MAQDSVSQENHGDPKAVTVDDGLAKVHEAAEKLTEEDIEAMAEEARAAAEKTRQAHGH